MTTLAEVEVARGVQWDEANTAAFGKATCDLEPVAYRNLVHHLLGALSPMVAPDDFAEALEDARARVTP